MNKLQKKEEKAFKWIFVYRPDGIRPNHKKFLYWHKRQVVLMHKLYGKRIVKATRDILGYEQKTRNNKNRL